MKKPPLWNLLRKVHRCEAGSVSLETVLVVGVIALPILLFMIRVGWPRIKNLLIKGLDAVESGASQAQLGQ